MICVRFLKNVHTKQMQLIKFCTFHIEMQSFMNGNNEQ